MIHEKKIVEIAHQIASANLTGTNISKVISEPFTDSEGRDALRITIVLKPDAVAKIGGEQTLNTLFEINERLQLEGEERFPIIEYATEEELKESGDS